ncbi:MAG: SMP-30/gluconolactonase/LRE family protein [Verrucomicrobiota bacterium]|jgi:gluconolactonase
MRTFPSWCIGLACCLLQGVAIPAVWGQESSWLAAGAKLEKLSEGYLFTEGPATDRQGNVFFTDQPNDRIVRWDAEKGTFSDWLRPAGRSNGMYFDAHGNLIACADGHNELWSIAPDKKVTVLVRDFGGKLLNGPNDVWVHPSGGLYFTDPFYKRPYWSRGPSEQGGQHVYYLASTDGKVSPRRVTEDLRQPNGIVGTPDGRSLYVADIGAGRTYRFAIQGDGSLGGKTLLCEMGSDGMTLDSKGNVYLTGKGVTIFSPSGEKVGHVDVPEPWTANVRFGGKDRDLLFITAGKAVYGARMKVPGVR